MTETENEKIQSKDVWRDSQTDEYRVRKMSERVNVCERESEDP